MRCYHLVAPSNSLGCSVFFTRRWGREVPIRGFRVEDRFHGAEDAENGVDGVFDCAGGAKVGEGDCWVGGVRWGFG